MSERAKMVAQSLTVLFLSKEPWRGEVKLNQTSFKNLNSSFTIDMMQTCVSTKATATSLPEGVSTKKISSHIKIPVVSLSIPPLQHFVIMILFNVFLLIYEEKPSLALCLNNYEVFQSDNTAEGSCSMLLSTMYSKDLVPLGNKNSAMSQVLWRHCRNYGYPRDGQITSSETLQDRCHQDPTNPHCLHSGTYCYTRTSAMLFRNKKKKKDLP